MRYRLRAKTNLFFIISLCFAAILHADEKQKANAAQDIRIKQALRLAEEWADAVVAYQRIPGASIGVVRGQELIWSKGFGHADVQRKTPATPETLYGICSISKLFTSIAVMQQRDAGKLRLDDPVTDYLPYANLPQASKDASTLTVRSLMTHSSGLPRESAHPYWTDPDFAFPTKDEVIQGLKTQSMLYEPDRYYQYSNLGLTFAGQIVEKVAAKSYEDYVQEAILKPLALSHTTPFLPEGEKGKLLATGYGSLTREGTRELMPFYQTRGIAPAAGFASNVKDLATFASWQFRLQKNGGTEILKASTLREMQRVHWIDPDWNTTWGLGFRVVRDDDNGTMVGHAGACPGYYTALEMVPQKQIAAIVLTNAMNINTRKFASTILDIVTPTLEEKWEAKEPVPDFERFTGAYWSAWGEMIIVPWKDGLAVLEVPTEDPAGDLTELKHVEGNAFRRIRTDGEDLGETVVFETAPDGKVARILWHQLYIRKIR